MVLWCPGRRRHEPCRVKNNLCGHNLANIINFPSCNHVNIQIFLKQSLLTTSSAPGVLHDALIPIYQRHVQTFLWKIFDVLHIVTRLRQNVSTLNILFNTALTDNSWKQSVLFWWRSEANVRDYSHVNSSSITKIWCRKIQVFYKILNCLNIFIKI